MKAKQLLLVVLTVFVAGPAFGERLRIGSGGCVYLKPLAQREEVKVEKEKFFLGAIEKKDEIKIDYRPAFETGDEATLKAKNFNVKAEILNVLNLNSRKYATILHVTITDTEDDRIIAEQRQYADSKAALNTMVIDFRHPRTDEAYVVGVRR